MDKNSFWSGISSDVFYAATQCKTYGEKLAKRQHERLDGLHPADGRNRVIYRPVDRAGLARFVQPDAGHLDW